MTEVAPGWAASPDAVFLRQLEGERDQLEGIRHLLPAAFSLIDAGVARLRQTQACGATAGLRSDADSDMRRPTCTAAAAPAAVAAHAARGTCIGDSEPTLALGIAPGPAPPPIAGPLGIDPQLARALLRLVAAGSGAAAAAVAAGAAAAAAAAARANGAPVAGSAADAAAAAGPAAAFGPGASGPHVRHMHSAYGGQGIGGLGLGLAPVDAAAPPAPMDQATAVRIMREWLAARQISMMAGGTGASAATSAAATRPVADSAIDSENAPRRRPEISTSAHHNLDALPAQAPHDQYLGIGSSGRDSRRDSDPDAPHVDASAAMLRLARALGLAPPSRRDDGSPADPDREAGAVTGPAAGKRARAPGSTHSDEDNMIGMHMPLGRATDHVLRPAANCKPEPPARQANYRCASGRPVARRPTAGTTAASLSARDGVRAHEHRRDGDAGLGPGGAAAHYAAAILKLACDSRSVCMLDQHRPGRRGDQMHPDSDGAKPASRNGSHIHDGPCGPPPPGGEAPIGPRASVNFWPPQPSVLGSAAPWAAAPAATLGSGPCLSLGDADRDAAAAVARAAAVAAIAAMRQACQLQPHYGHPPTPSCARKSRRLWTAEMHARFVEAVEVNGGPDVVTPRILRGHLTQAGLTNDEVKSHLQKYRLALRSPATRTSRDIDSDPISMSHSTAVAAAAAGPGPGAPCGGAAPPRQAGSSFRTRRASRFLATSEARPSSCTPRASDRDLDESGGNSLSAGPGRGETGSESDATVAVTGTFDSDAWARARGAGRAAAAAVVGGSPSAAGADGLIMMAAAAAESDPGPDPWAQLASAAFRLENGAGSASFSGELQVVGPLAAIPARGTGGPAECRSESAITTGDASVGGGSGAVPHASAPGEPLRNRAFESAAEQLMLQLPTAAREAASEPEPPAHVLRTQLPPDVLAAAAAWLEELRALRN